MCVPNEITRQDKEMVKRVNITVDEQLLKEIDEAALHKNMTRSAYLLAAAQERMAADRFLQARPDILLKMVDLKEALSQVAMNSDLLDSSNT